MRRSVPPIHEQLRTIENLLGWFFFFQAEEGIRGDLVTGVQTCALPISTADVVSVNDAATLDGTLVVNPTGTFHAGQSFVLVDANAVTVNGTFGISPPDLGAGQIGRASCRERV